MMLQRQPLPPAGSLSDTTIKRKSYNERTIPLIYVALNYYCNLRLLRFEIRLGKAIYQNYYKIEMEIACLNR